MIFLRIIHAGIDLRLPIVRKNNRLTHLGEMPRVGGFSPTYSLHVNSCSAKSSGLGRLKLAQR